jgi:hypothetical protein
LAGGSTTRSSRSTVSALACAGRKWATTHNGSTTRGRLGLSPTATAVTLAATDKALYPAQFFAPFGNGYWWAGKKIGLRVFGRATTGATPGNFSWSLYFGSGADATGTLLGTSKVIAAVANAVNLCWMAQLELDCRVIGSAGSILATGFIFADSALIANVVPFPASAPVAVAVDLTAGSNILSLQLKRSGSTAESAQVHQILPSPLN